MIPLQYPRLEAYISPRGEGGGGGGGTNGIILNSVTRMGLHNL